MKEVIYKLVYVSTAAYLINEEELLGILKLARQNNKSNNLTGLLLYHDGSFIQLLEGRKQDVETLYNKIALDPRHFGMIRLLEDYSEKRDFPDWSMGFQRIDASLNKEIEGFSFLLENNPLSSSELQELSMKVRLLLDTFKKTSGVVMYTGNGR